jgi:hypothetical protein
MLTPTALHHYMVAELEKDEKHTTPANGAKNRSDAVSLPPPPPHQHPYALATWASLPTT